MLVVPEELRGLLALVNRTAPDVALIDIKMPPTHTDEGLQAATIIRQRHPGTAVLLLSAPWSPATHPRCWKATQRVLDTCSKNGSMTRLSWQTHWSGYAQASA